MKVHSFVSSSPTFIFGSLMPVKHACNASRIHQIAILRAASTFTGSFVAVSMKSYMVHSIRFSDTAAVVGKASTSQLLRTKS